MPDLFERGPEIFPYGHPLRGPGRVLISWTPCICEAAKEAACGRGMGHIRLDCRGCEAEGRVTVFYEPPHDAAQPPARLRRGHLYPAARGVDSPARQGCHSAPDAYPCRPDYA